MNSLVQILLGSALAIVGGMLGAWYSQQLAARAAKRERFRSIYHSLLAVASASRTFARSGVDDGLHSDGVVSEWWIRHQEGELRELVGFFREARKSASWLDFETDLRSIEGKLRFSTLDWTFYTYQMALERLKHEQSAEGVAELVNAKRSLDACADDLARAIRQHMLELELPLPAAIPGLSRRRLSRADAPDVLTERHVPRRHRRRRLLALRARRTE